MIFVFCVVIRGAPRGGIAIALLKSYWYIHSLQLRLKAAYTDLRSCSLWYLFWYSQSLKCT